MRLTKRSEGVDDCLEQVHDRGAEELVADDGDRGDEGEDEGVFRRGLTVVCGCGCAAYDLVRGTSLRFVDVDRGSDAS